MSVTISKEIAINIIESYCHYNSDYSYRIDKFINYEFDLDRSMNKKEFTEWLENASEETLYKLLSKI